MEERGGLLSKLEDLKRVYDFEKIVLEEKENNLVEKSKEIILEILKRNGGKFVFSSEKFKMFHVTIEWGEYEVLKEIYIIDDIIMVKLITEEIVIDSLVSDSIYEIAKFLIKNCK